jgi:hypothetical protein
VTPSGGSDSRLLRAGAALDATVVLGRPADHLPPGVDAEEFAKIGSSIYQQALEQRAVTVPMDRELAPYLALDSFLMGFKLGIAFEREPDVA